MSRKEKKERTEEIHDLRIPIHVCTWYILLKI